MAKLGEKLSTKTKMKISESKKGQIPWNKGREGLQTAWNKGKTGSIPWNKGIGGICSADGCNGKHQAKEFCDYHYRRFRKGIPFDKLKHGEMKKKICIVESCKKNAIAEFYCDRHYNIIRNGRRSDKVIHLLGGKCDSCGERHDPKLQRSNLEIHHLHYDKIDLKQKKEGKRRSGAQVPMEILRMVKNGKDPKKKFTLLCHPCHMIETYAHQDEKKTKSIFSWLIDHKLLTFKNISRR